MIRRLSTLALTQLFLSTSSAQLPKQWLGNWSGMMFMYNYGTLVDSVSVTFTAKPLTQEGSYTWRIEYHSAKMPMVKDYILRVRDAAKGFYVTDEGGRIMTIRIDFSLSGIQRISADGYDAECEVSQAHVRA
jgi:hypothetical protein